MADDETPWEAPLSQREMAIALAPYMERTTLQPCSVRQARHLIETGQKTLGAAKSEGAVRVRGRDGKSYPADAGKHDLTVAFVFQLREQGMTQAEIATRLGISQPTVSRILRSYDADLLSQLRRRVRFDEYRLIDDAS